MAAGFSAEDRAEFARQSVRLLVARARVGLWILATFALFFTALDWSANPGHFSVTQRVQIAALRAGQLLCIVMVFPALARRSTWRGAVTVNVLFMAMFTATIVLAGVVARDPALAPTVLMGTSMFSAAFLPWGPRAQTIVAAIAAVGLMASAVALADWFSPAGGYNTLEAFAVLAASVWVAGSLDRQRWALFAAERAREDAIAAQLREAEVAEALARVGREMIEAAGAPQLVERLCAVTASVMGCDVVHAYLRETDGDAYVPVAAWGESADEWEMLRLVHFTPDWVADLVQQLGEDGIVEASPASHGPLDAAVAAMLQRGGITRSLFMALRHGDALLGVLHAGSRGGVVPFTAAQRRIAHGIAHLAAMTIEHARVRAELEQANRVKAHFVATLSHELRNPITAIQGYHQLLLVDSDPLTADQEHIVRRADKCAQELNELITATLDLSRFTAQRVPVDVRPISIHDLVEELRGETPPPADPTCVRLEWHVDTDAPVIRTDPLKLKMIMRNLVTNALKFTERGTVTTTARFRDNGLELRIADTGIGIAPDKVGTLFEPFTQAHGMQSRRKGGAGLGLHLVRRLVDVLGGTIEVESVVGRGSTFRVWLPDAPCAQAADGTHDSDGRATAAAPSVPAALP